MYRNFVRISNMIPVSGTLMELCIGISALPSTSRSILNQTVIVTLLLSPVYGFYTSNTNILEAVINHDIPCLTERNKYHLL